MYYLGYWTIEIIAVILILGTYLIIKKVYKTKKKSTIIQNK